MSEHGPSALVIQDVHTYYGEGYVLQGVSLHVEQGTVVAVLGRNGVGKTTLIRTIIAFTPARRGEVIFKGMDITRAPAYRIVQMGMGIVPQGRRIFPSLTVRENLEIAYRAGAARDTGQRWDVKRVMDLFPRLQERALGRAGQLSGGEQQMLALARALIGNPDFLLMDEPSEGLSPFLVEELKGLVHQLKSTGLSVLLVEQHLAFALEVADYVYVMDKGRIVYESPPGRLAENEEVKTMYLGL